MPALLLEIACFNPESALIAQNAGADRIELCDDYASGGITPSAETVKQVRKLISIPLFVMIRPRGGNFIYSDSEFEAMKNFILQFKALRVDGVVTGILTTENQIDKRRCTELAQLAKPMQLTFHRAFDATEKPQVTMEEIIDCSFDRILTSGKKENAPEGASLISELINSAKDRISIMPGGGIRSDNIAELIKTGAKEFHSSAINTKTMLPDETSIQQMKKLISL